LIEFHGGNGNDGNCSNVGYSNNNHYPYKTNNKITTAAAENARREWLQRRQQLEQEQKQPKKKKRTKRSYRGGKVNIGELVSCVLYGSTAEKRRIHTLAAKRKWRLQNKQKVRESRRKWRKK
jgi:hypothetical protein